MLPRPMEKTSIYCFLKEQNFNMRKKKNLIFVSCLVHDGDIRQLNYGSVSDDMIFRESRVHYIILAVLHFDTVPPFLLYSSFLAI